MSEPTDTNEASNSKSRVKRELAELKHLGERLASLGYEQLEQLMDERLRDAIIEAKKLKPGNARKRQIQYVGKLLRSFDHSQAAELLDIQDAGSRRHNQRFHRLEKWRAGLIENNPETMNEILTECPHADRTHLRHLARSAIREANEHDDQKQHSRKLFRFLRFLIENPQEQ